MIRRETITKVLKITMLPSLLAGVFFLGVPLLPFKIPLFITLGLLALTLVNVAVSISASSYTLNYDGTFKRPEPLLFIVFAPFMIGLQGAQYGGYGEAIASNLPIVTMVALLLAMLVGFIASMSIGRKYKPIYDQEKTERAEIALRRALDKATRLSAADRASIEARAAGMAYADVFKMAEAIEKVGELTPELL